MTDTETNQQDPHAALEQAAQHLYDAECALHIARQTRVDAWITAAADHLHLAVLELDAADHALADHALTGTQRTGAATTHASVA